MTISPSRASLRARRMAAWRSGSTTWGTSNRRIPTRASFMMARGSSERGLSLVRTTKSLASAAAWPMRGRLERARAPQPQRVVHDGQRIFGARVVAGEDDEVAGFGGCLAHEGTLGAVAVAAAAEEGDDALWVEPASHGNDVAQRVVGVRVIHHDDEGLAFIDALETPGNGLEIGD